MPRRPKLDPLTPQQQMAVTFGYANAQLPYTYDEQTAAQKIVDALFLLPTSLTLRIHEGRLIITSTDSEKPTLRDCPIQRGTDWEKWPMRPFFALSEADFEALELTNYRTVGDLARLLQTRTKLPHFGQKRLELLEQLFEEFWAKHPELCQ